MPKIRKLLYNAWESPLISNYRTPTETASEFLDFHLKPLMPSGSSYIQDSEAFIDKMERIGIVPEGFSLVTEYVVSQVGILRLQNKLKEETSSKICTNGLVKLVKFVLRGSIFEFSNEVKQ